MKSDRQKLTEKLAALEAKYNAAMRGRMVATPAAMRIKREMADIEYDIINLDRLAAERFNLGQAPLDEVLEVIAIPLLADLMNDLVAGVDGNLRKRGISQTVFSTYTTQIRRASLAMIDTLAEAEANLPRLLDTDDTLIDALRKKLLSFIKQRLNIKKK